MDAPQSSRLRPNALYRRAPSPALRRRAGAPFPQMPEAARVGPASYPRRITAFGRHFRRHSEATPSSRKIAIRTVHPPGNGDTRGTRGMSPMVTPCKTGRESSQRPPVRHGVRRQEAAEGAREKGSRTRWGIAPSHPEK